MRLDNTLIVCHDIGIMSSAVRKDFKTGGISITLPTDLIERVNSIVQKRMDERNDRYYSRSLFIREVLELFFVQDITDGKRERSDG